MEGGGAKCHLGKIGLDPGATRGPGTILQGNDTIIFHLWEKRMVVSTQGTVGEKSGMGGRSRSQELSLIGICRFEQEEQSACSNRRGEEAGARFLGCFWGRIGRTW